MFKTKKICNTSEHNVENEFKCCLIKKKKKKTGGREKNSVALN